MISKYSSNKYKTLEEVFCENSPAPRTTVRAKIIRHNLIPYECECGNKGEWVNKKLVLNLHHKNAVINDNRLENLCFLCPNCHSQTETFAANKAHMNRKSMQGSRIDLSVTRASQVYG